MAPAPSPERSPEETPYRVHPALICCTMVLDGARIVAAIETCRQPPSILTAPASLAALLALPPNFTKTDAVAIWERLGIASSSIEVFWNFLVSEHMIIAYEDACFNAELVERWANYGWVEAGIYHSATRDYGFVQMNSLVGFAEDRLRMKAYMSEVPPPSIYQTFDSSINISLPKLPDNLDSYVDSLSPVDRRELPGLSVLFHLACGEQGRLDFGVQGQFLHKAVPSGGARHPTEAFYLAFHHETLSSGVYHYNVQKHALTCLGNSDPLEEARRATYDLFDKFTTPPFGMFVLTSLVHRAMWRYRDPRSFRAILIDVGHVMMAFRVGMTRLGLSTYTYQKFDDTGICSMLGLHLEEQVPLYVATLV